MTRRPARSLPRRTALHQALALHRRTLAIAGLVALATLQPATARAADECGALAPGGSVTCEATPDPYAGIDYQGVQDGTVVLGEGAHVDGSVAVMGDGSVRFIASGGSAIHGGVAPALEVASTSGSVEVVADEVIGGLHGIAALSGGGDVVVEAGYVEADIAIQAESTGGSVTVRAGELLAGPGGAGVVAGTIDGDISVSVDHIGIHDALYSQGVLAVSDHGDVSVDVGSIAFEGYRSEGVRAITLDGDIDVSVDQVSIIGGEVVGIFAGSQEGDVTIRAGDVSVLGDVARGIFADSLGDVTLEAGRVVTDGFIADAVQLLSWDGDVRARVDEIVAGGDWSTGISAEAAGDVDFDIGHVTTYGEYANGIGAFAGGDVTIRADYVETFGQGSAGIVVGTNEGDQLVEVGQVIVHANETEPTAAIATSTWSGDVRINVLDEVVAENGPAILSQSVEGSVHVDVRQGALVWGSLAGIMAEGGAGTRVDVGGIVVSRDGPALMLLGGDADVRIAASGRVYGSIETGDGDDRVANDGRVLLSGQSEFGAGEDVFANRGVVALRSLEGLQTVSVAGLERFENTGLVTLGNGYAGDLLSISGDFAGGSGSTVAMDVSLLDGGAADTLQVGSASGTTRLALNLLQSASGLGLDGPVLVQAAGDVDGSEFVLAGTRYGWVDFALDFDAGDRTWSLASDLGDRAYRTTVIADGARELWRAGTQAWSAGLREARADGVHAYAQVLSGEQDREADARSALGRRDLAWTSQVDGLQAGVETVHGGWRVGVLGGTGQSEMLFGDGDRSEFDGRHFGAYAAYAAGTGWYGQALLRADWLDLDTRWQSAGIASSDDARVMGLVLEAGRRVALGGLWLQPSARLQWTDTELPDLAGEAGTAELAGGDVLGGELGLALGNQAGEGGLPFQWTVDVALGREAGGDGDVRLGVDDEVVALGRDGAATYGRVGVGIGRRFGRVDLGARLEQAFGDAEGLSGMLSARVSF